MRIIKSILVAASISLCSMSAFAQSDCTGECSKLGYAPYPYGFVQVQGGLGTTFTDVPFTKLLSPTVSVGVGGWFNSAVGARLHVNAWKSKGGFNKLTNFIPGETEWNEGYNAWEKLGSPVTYNYNYFNTNVDLMLNVINLFSKNKHHAFDVVLIGGIGLNYAWNNKDLQNILACGYYQPSASTVNAWGPGTSRKQLLSHNIRAGILFDVNVAKNWAVGLEVDANSLSDRFNSKYNNSDDWMVTAQLGVTYKFGFKPAHVKAPEQVAAVPAIPVVKAEPAKVVEPAPVKKEEPVKVVEEPYRDVIYYAIREADVDKESIINACAAWCKKYPNKTINVSGYADKGTGNAKLNKMYAAQRANKVVEMLKAKGVPASQIKSASYGDTVQPFSENDKNRCVILEGK